MLGYYASRFPTVEINNTFYRLPKEHVLQDWAAQVPEPFTFAIKASQRITHFARLKPEGASARRVPAQEHVVARRRLGPILFQLPPNLKKDVDRLRAFLDTLPARSAVHDRVSPRELVRRRRVRRAARARHRDVHHRSAGLRVAGRVDGVVGLRAAAPLRLRRRRRSPSGRSASRRSRGAKRTSTSSTTRASARDRPPSTHFGKSSEVELLRRSRVTRVGVMPAIRQAVTSEPASVVLRARRP